MSIWTRPGPSMLQTLVADLLAGNPRRARQAAGNNLVDQCYADLLAGEPKKARRTIDTFPPDAPLTRALQLWAWQLDCNTYPGGTGGENTGAPEQFITPTSDDPETLLVELIAASGPPGMGTPRSIIENAMRQGATDIASSIGAEMISTLEATSAEAARLGDRASSWWCYLAIADLAHRLGLVDDAHARLAHVRGTAATVPELAALTFLIEGDWLATPRSSPETLGFLLAEAGPEQPGPAPDVERAASCYAQAVDLAPPHASPRLAGALSLRLAVLEWFNDDTAGYRTHLEQAAAHYSVAGDMGGVTLINTHLVVADLDDGRLAQHNLAFGSGRQPPLTGPIAGIRNWSLTDGSKSWAVGLGRLLERVGQAWVVSGRQSRARVALLAALPLLRLNSDIPTRSVDTAIAAVDSQQGLTSNALTRLERSLMTMPALTPETDVVALTVAANFEVIMVVVQAQLARTRTAAALHAARSLLRLRKMLVSMLESPAIHALDGTRIDDPRAAQQSLRDAATMRPDINAGEALTVLQEGTGYLQMIELLVGEIRGQLDVLDVMAPLARAEHAHRRGEMDVATAWYDTALRAARRPTAPNYLAPTVLATAGRFAEASAELARLDGQLPDDYLAPLAVRCREYQRAAEAYARLEQTSTDWRDALTRAEIARGLSDARQAYDSATDGIRQFEATVAGLVRDPDRIASCDRPDVPSLYVTAALAAKDLADRSEPDHAAEHLTRAFELSERLRSVAFGNLDSDDEGGDAWLSWQESAAQWSATKDRLLAAIDSDVSDLPTLLAAEEAAEERLLRAEHELETARPGFLIRHNRPPDLPPVYELQRALPAGALVLEYLAVGEDLLMWAVTRQSMVAEHRPITSRGLIATVRTYHRQCADGHGDGKSLAELLLVPVAEAIRASERIIIVPFGPLNLVPFHALPFDGKPLGLSRAVSYAPNAWHIARNGGLDRALTIRRSLVVGDPAHDEERGLSRLSGSRIEAECVGRLLETPPANLLIAEKASGRAVRDRVVGLDVLHLATHGLLDELAPLASCLVLAGKDTLTAADLVGLHIGSKLAVLSGCDTGRGAATLGGDLVGLTRSLIRAGVERVIVSLWPVDDDVAAVTMHAFYSELVKGHPAAIALANAQRIIHGSTDEELRQRFTALGGTRAGGTRRGGLQLPPEFRDDEPLPELLKGDAERYWAPFILVEN